MDSDLGALERRLAKAEHNVKLLSIVLGSMILISLIRAKYSTPSTVHAPFQVVDERGVALFQVGQSPDGGQSWVRLAQPPGGEANVVLYAGSEGNGLDLMESGRAAAGLSVGGKRRGLAIYDPLSDHAALLSVAPEGGALIFTRRGAERGAAVGVAGRHGYLELYDPKGKPTLTAP
jgi:hypothetical protein